MSTHSTYIFAAGYEHVVLNSIHECITRNPNCGERKLFQAVHEFQKEVFSGLGVLPWDFLSICTLLIYIVIYIVQKRWYRGGGKLGYSIV